MKRGMKITLGVIGGILVLAVLASMGGNDDAGGERPAESASDGSAGETGGADTGTGEGATSATPHAPDEGCDGKRNCVRLTLIGSERKECLGEGMCADEGMEYLVARVRVENTGTSEVDTNTFYFEAQREGVTHTSDAATFFMDGAMQLVTLQTGGAQEGALAFLVPKDAAVTEVCFEPPVVTFGKTPRHCAPVRE